jgi:hypothetical protein
MLGPGELAPIPITLDPNLNHTFTRNLNDGRFTHAILIDQDEETHAFAIPEMPKDERNAENRMSLVGRVAKR